MSPEEIRVTALVQAVLATRLPGSYPGATTVIAFAEEFEKYIEGEATSEH